MPRHIGNPWWTLLALTLCCGVCSAAPPSGAVPGPFAGLGSRLDEIRKADHLTGFAVAVARHGKIVYEKGFGWADREKRIAATEHTMFSLASVSKPMTATGIMTLVQSGKLGLDQPVNDYLGDAKLKAWVGEATQATVRRVANHSSGLPLHFQYFFADESFRAPSRDETILHYGNLVTPPGEHYQYSNVGYGVLDYLITRISGEPYAAYMHRQVFSKLGMSHTSAGVDPPLARFVATRYDDDGSALPPYETDTPGASVVYSSAHDVVRFGMFHLKDHLANQSQILSDESLDEMHRPTMREGASASPAYAIGWEVLDQADGYHVVTHTGGMPGVATALVLVPGEDIAVALVANGFRYDLNDALDLIMRTMLPTWKGSPSPRDDKPPPFKPQPDLVGTWAGRVHTYMGDRVAELQFLSDGRVAMRLGEGASATVSDVAVKAGSLTGITHGELNTPDVDRRRPYALELNLQIREGSLTGCATAFRSEGRPFGLSHWAEFHRQRR